MERIIAYYCAPALAGIKPANIVSCHKSKIQNIHGELERLNAQLNVRNIYFEVLSECSNRVLVMVYRKELLQKTLNGKEMNMFLASFGYPCNAAVERYIDFLKIRMKNSEFPHEIGVFLGYPLHDIQGFIYHKDWGCLLCGEWKVYKDAESAKKLFKRFADCRRAVMKKVFMGHTLAQIFCAA